MRCVKLLAHFHINIVVSFTVWLPPLNITDHLMFLGLSLKFSLVSVYNLLILPNDIRMIPKETQNFHDKFEKGVQNFRRETSWKETA